MGYIHTYYCRYLTYVCTYIHRYVCTVCVHVTIRICLPPTELLMTAKTPRPELPCTWPVQWQELGLAMPVFTSATGCPTPSLGRSRASLQRTTTRTSPWWYVRRWTGLGANLLYAYDILKPLPSPDSRAFFNPHTTVSLPLSSIFTLSTTCIYTVPLQPHPSPLTPSHAFILHPFPFPLTSSRTASLL